MPLAAATAMAQTNLSQYIQHVIVVIQENRTPDNLFNQDYVLAGSGAHVQPPNNGGLVNCPEGSPDIPLQGAPLFTCWDTRHSHRKTQNPSDSPDWINMWDSGKMDGACQISVLG